MNPNRRSCRRSAVSSILGNVVHIKAACTQSAALPTKQETSKGREDEDNAGLEEVDRSLRNHGCVRGHGLLRILLVSHEIECLDARSCRLVAVHGTAFTRLCATLEKECRTPMSTAVLLSPNLFWSLPFQPITSMRASSVITARGLLPLEIPSVVVEATALAGEVGSG